jgi:hypothetical protein
MRSLQALLILAVVLTAAPSASAINLFSRRAKVNPAERVPELLSIVKSAAEERKRVSAVDELRQYDAAAFPQIVPVLLDVLKTDPSTSVRVEAAHSLGRLRPASPAVAQVLDGAAGHDASTRVRWQARAALLFYPASVPHTAARPNEPSSQQPRPTVSAGPAPMVPANPVLLPVPGQGQPVTTSQPPPTATGIARPLPRGPEPRPATPTPPAATGEPPLAGPTPVIVPEPPDGPVLAPPP